MMKDYHFTLEQALYELPIRQAFAFAAFSSENQPWASVERITPGYIAQEIKARMA